MPTQLEVKFQKRLSWKNQHAQKMKAFLRLLKGEYQGMETKFFPLSGLHFVREWIYLLQMEMSEQFLLQFLPQLR